MEAIDDRSYFFDEGLRFECRQCGACCQGAPGLVKLTHIELQALGAALGRSCADLLNSGVVYPHADAYRLHEETADGRCVFFENGVCSIYHARPQQCRTWPFWFANLRSKERWRLAAKACPGMGHGRLYTKAEILAFLNT